MLKSLTTGEYSHFMPVLICLIFVGFAVLFNLNLTFQIAGCLLIILGWYMYRFGYEQEISHELKHGNYKEAVELCESAMEKYPTDSYALVYGAAAHAGLYNQEKAAELTSIAINKGVRLPLAYLIRAQANLFTNQFSRAEEDLANALGMMSTDTEVPCLILQAEIYTRQGNYPKAIATLTKAAGVVNHSAYVYINRAENHCRMRNFESAQHDLDVLKDCSTAFIKAARLCIEARLRLLKNEEDRALECTTEAIKILETPAMLASHGLTLTRSGNHSEALKFLNRSVQLDPYAPEARWFRGELHERMGDAPAAEEDKKFASEHGYVPYL